MEIYLPHQQYLYKAASLKRLGLRDLAAYRATPWWKQFKKEYRKRHEYRCTVCGATQGLEIDHESYEHLGCERDSEVNYKCDACHVAKHERWNRVALEERDRGLWRTDKKKPPVTRRGGLIHFLGVVSRIIWYLIFY